MIDLERYDRLLLSGEWHVHTSYVDGEASVEDYCDRGEKIGLPLIAFTEHVRRNLDYDFESLLADIEEARCIYRLTILSGCEAKVLPGGELDVDDDLLRRVDYPIFAFHSFPPDKDLYLDSLKAVIKSRKAATWAHPGLFLKKTGFELCRDELAEILKLLAESGIRLEINRKHDLPPPRWLDSASNLNVKLVRGSDVHFLRNLLP